MYKHNIFGTMVIGYYKRKGGTEEKMQEAEYQTLMEESLEIIIVFDGMGRILFSNRTAEEELGYPEGMIGIPIAKVLIQEFEVRRECREVMQQLADRGQTFCYRMNETCFRAAVRVSYNQAKDRYYFFALNEEKNEKMERKIEQIKVMTEQALGACNEFVANMTHELRTPVNGIRGHVENLKEGCLTSEQRRTLEIIEGCCNNMSSIINNILDFSKLEAGKIELEECRFEVRELLQKLVMANMPLVNEKGLQLSVDVDEGIPRFLIGDELRITQILNNLLSNAIKFTSVGFVRIEATQTYRHKDEIEIFFMVADSGTGISKEEQDKLFKSFSQVDASITRRYGGTGLGLAITKNLVELMGGRIYLESEKGRGSNFSFSVRLKVVEDDETMLEYKREIQEFMKSAGRSEDYAAADEYYRFGSIQNQTEIKSRMEKLILCIELNAWEKAELWLEELKKLVENADEAVKRSVLRLGMAIRKENYDSSMEQYEKVKQLLESVNGDDWDGSRIKEGRNAAYINRG